MRRATFSVLVVVAPGSISRRTFLENRYASFTGCRPTCGPQGTDCAALMPSPGDGTLRALYLGDIAPELVLRNIIRFSLYSDTIFVIDPFVNPHIVSPKYNPIDNPNKHKADTLKLIYFLFSVAPWIESGMLYLIPDPGDLNLDLKLET